MRYLYTFIVFALVFMACEREAQPLPTWYEPLYVKDVNVGSTALRNQPFSLGFTAVLYNGCVGYSGSTIKYTGPLEAEVEAYWQPDVDPATLICNQAIYFKDTAVALSFSTPGLASIHIKRGSEILQTVRVQIQ